MYVGVAGAEIAAADGRLEAQSLVLLQRIQARAQAGLVASGGVFVENAFLNGLVEGGNCLAKNLLRGRLIASGQCFAQAPEFGAQTRAVAAVLHSAGFSLTGALQRRKMVCHRSSIPLAKDFQQRSVPCGASRQVSDNLFYENRLQLVKRENANRSGLREDAGISS